MTRLVVAATLALGCSAPAADDDFWSTPRRGANSQSTSLTPDYWRAAADLGVDFVRLAPDAWPAAERDFLIGDADRFDGIPPADLASLLAQLDAAHAAGVRVVLTMFSLPGARWRQRNADRDDARLWHDVAWHEQAADFWAELAGHLRGHPAIVAYNPLNEPHPDRAFGFADPTAPEAMRWVERVRGTPADLNAFNRRMVSAIRSVDAATPIMLDAGFHASPAAMGFVEPLDDPRVLYAFHLYAPWEYTTWRVNDGRFAYPERMPGRDGPEPWDRGHLATYLVPVAAWAAAHGVQPSRIVAAEFGADRRVPGADAWLTDVVAAIEAPGWHWAFYAFRQDDAWGGMDYELGTGPLGAAYWAAIEGGADPESLKARGDNPLWRVITEAVSARRPSSSSPPD